MSDDDETRPHDVVDFRLKRLEKRADDNSALHKAIAKEFAERNQAFAELKAGNDRCETLAGEIKGDIRWVSKLVLGAVIAAILALVIKSAASQTPNTHSSLPLESATGLHSSP